MPIDELTFARFQAAEAKAKELGLSLAEVLDKAGLLLTAKRQHDIRVQAVEDVYRRLDRQSANKLMSFYHSRQEGTSAEMLFAVKQWFEAVCRHLAEKTLEDL